LSIEKDGIKITNEEAIRRLKMYPNKDDLDKKITSALIGLLEKDLLEAKIFYDGRLGFKTKDEKY